MTTHELFIDPSTKAMGWALFQLYSSHPYDGPESISLLSSGVMKLKKDMDNDSNLEWIDRVDQMVEFVDRSTNQLEHRVHRVFIEMPSVYTGGKGGAAANSGAIMKLAFCVASIRSILRAKAVEVTLLPVRTWKGTVPKRITRMRINRYWGIDKLDHNEMDAIGMGDWHYRKHLKKGAFIQQAK